MPQVAPAGGKEGQHMAGRNGGSLLQRIAERRSLRRWRDAASKVSALDPEGLRGLRARARALRNEVDTVLRATEQRLTAFPSDTSVRKPSGSDWAWRPPLWRVKAHPHGIAGAQSRDKLGDDLTLFHDCPRSEITLRQIRNTKGETLAPFGLRLDVLRFEGSFLSLVLDLPDAALGGLQLNHLIRLEMQLDCERELEVFCRLNIKHGPNSEQLVRELPHGDGARSVEFDLAYTRMNERRLEKAWVDLIFENPRMNEVVIRDLTFARYPRAEL